MSLLYETSKGFYAGAGTRQLGKRARRPTGPFPVATTIIDEENPIFLAVSSLDGMKRTPFPPM